MAEEKKEKYLAMKKWNRFVLHIHRAREAWEETQEEIEVMDRRSIENFSIEAQRHLNRFRGVKFEWMIPMFVDYYRGAGGLDSMHIILPVTAKEEKKNGSKKD